MKPQLLCTKSTAIFAF